MHLCTKNKPKANPPKPKEQIAGDHHHQSILVGSSTKKLWEHFELRASFGRSFTPLGIFSWNGWYSNAVGMLVVMMAEEF